MPLQIQVITQAAVQPLFFAGVPLRTIIMVMGEAVTQAAQALVALVQTVRVVAAVVRLNFIRYFYGNCLL